MMFCVSDEMKLNIQYLMVFIQLFPRSGPLRQTFALLSRMEEVPCWMETSLKDFLTLSLTVTLVYRL